MALIAGVGGGLVYRATPRRLLDRDADQVLQAPDAGTVTEPVAGGGDRHPREVRLPRAGGLVVSDMPAAEAGKAYQMWLQSPDADGLGRLMPDAEPTTVLTGDAATAAAAAVSVEPEGGSKQPTSEPIAFPVGDACHGERVD